MSVVDEARRLITTDTSMAVSNPEWRRIVAGLLRIIDGDLRVQELSSTEKESACRQVT